MSAEAFLDVKRWRGVSFSLFLNLCPGKRPLLQTFLVFPTSSSFGTRFFVSGGIPDESGFWLTLHRKCTVNSCCDLGRQRYAWPSSDVIFTTPLSEYAMQSSLSGLGHSTSEKSMKIRFFLSEGMMLSDKKGQVAEEFRKSRACCSCSYKKKCRIFENHFRMAKVQYPRSLHILAASATSWY